MSANCVVSLPSSWDRFEHAWELDFEYFPDQNLLPDVLSMHALEHRSGREIALWRDALLSSTRPVIDIGPNDVIIAYSAMAEALCIQRLRLLPHRPHLICLFTEFMAMTNGLVGDKDKHPSLIRAVEMLGGGPPITRAYKKLMRDLILARREAVTPEERALIEAYNRTDNVMGRFVLSRIAHRIPIEHALLRGRSIWSLADSEARGLPVDLHPAYELGDHWQSIRRFYIERDDDLKLYDSDLLFSRARLEDLVAAKGWDWQRTPTGLLDIRATTLRKQARR